MRERERESKAASTRVVWTFEFCLGLSKATSGEYSDYQINLWQYTEGKKRISWQYLPQLSPVKNHGSRTQKNWGRCLTYISCILGPKVAKLPQLPTYSTAFKTWLLTAAKEPQTRYTGLPCINLTDWLTCTGGLLTKLGRVPCLWVRGLCDSNSCDLLEYLEELSCLLLC